MPFPIKNWPSDHASQQEWSIMPPTIAGERSVQQQLSDLGVRFLLTDLGTTSDCLREESLGHLSSLPLGDLSATVRRHILGCSRCAHLYACFRASDRIHALPEQSHITLRTDFHPQDDFDWQLLGNISLETRKFESCAEDDWVHSPLHVRVNVVVDKIVNFFSVS